MSEIQPLFHLFPIDVCYHIQHHLSTLKQIPAELGRDIRLYAHIHSLIRDRSVSELERLACSLASLANHPRQTVYVPPYACLLIPVIKSTWCRMSPHKKAWIVANFRFDEPQRAKTNLKTTCVWNNTSYT